MPLPKRLEGASTPDGTRNEATMEPTWELRAYDQEFFAKELDSFVPDEIFDSHAHLYEISHWASRSLIEKGPPVVTLDEFRRQMEWITPGRKTTGLFFGAGLSEARYEESNRFVAGEVARDPSIARAVDCFTQAGRRPGSRTW